MLKTLNKQKLWHRWWLNRATSERRKKMIKYIINDLKLASKEDWVYLAISLPVGLVALADWFIF